MTTLQIGSTLGGRYQIERLLGQGGTGTVALAHDAETGRDVALKVIRDELRTDPAVVARFTHEAETAAKLQSERVVHVNAVGHFEGVGPYMVMEYLRGSALSHVVGLHRPLPVLEAVSSALEVLEALETAHALGLLHLDLKPAQLFRVEAPDKSPSIKLLGGWTATVPARPRRPGMWGSPFYMSPERLREPHTGDVRTDIWGMGVVLYELLAGVPPFNGETLGELFLQIVSKDPESLRARRREIPAELDAIVMRCLQRDSSMRYADAHALTNALAMRS